MLKAGQHRCFCTAFGMSVPSIMSAELGSSGEIHTDEHGVPFRIDDIPQSLVVLLELYYFGDASVSLPN